MIQFDTIRAKVHYLLENYPSLREDDKKLWIAYMVMYLNLKNILCDASSPYADLQKLILDPNTPKTESIRRVRQKIQEKEFKRTGAVIKKKKNFVVKSRVGYLLSKNETLRDCDTKLWLAYLVTFHDLKKKLINSVDRYDAFCSLILSEDIPFMETIRRTRQALQEKGMFIGKLDRKQQAQVVRKWAISN